MEKIKVVVITGGASGIGLSTAELFSSTGFIVHVIDKKEPNQKMFENKINFHLCDISDFPKLTEVTEKILKENEQIDILINNAGIQIEEPFENYQVEEWKNVMNTNFFGTCNCINLLIDNMKEGSTVLNVLSIHSTKPRVNKYVYDSSKSAIETLTRELGLQYAPKKITFNAISFGAVNSDMNKIWKMKSNLKEEALKKVPLKIIFEPEQIANFIKIIVDNFSKYTTGSIFTIDGGRSLY